MSDISQDYKKLLTDAIRKQMIILGSQITLVKARNVKGLTVKDDGTVIEMTDNPQSTITQFLEEFRVLSSPLVKKTMQPLLSVIGQTKKEPVTTTHETIQTQAEAVVKN